ncbi:uncharacterized protein LOC106884260 isoform X1 [Octopus bimaculoides]|uniref:uncharacterized protein LOC106884260 isoform X1 n=1 Tax=Octopus bimaculoides TaxID=37653 RepID=UPI00071E17A2|nr:uncharacterized protein LOC106884260 isoform X1 [Octopus bimaculoides]|eukprot:XP_014791028.1 PREDICTED: uncharacterized protein LOC106884260 isoform X1 [Octopus bimaculoides]
MANPLFLVSVTSVVLGGVASLFMMIPLGSNFWEYYSYDEQALNTFNNSRSDIFNVVLVNPNESAKIYRVDFKPDKNNRSNTPAYLFSQYSGLIRICSQVSAETKAKCNHLPDMWKNPCYNFVTEYDEETSTLNAKGNILAKMQTSAASCLIVSTIDLMTASALGIIAVFKKQVALVMVTGTLYMMAGIFGVFTLVITYTKRTYEIEDCFYFVTLPPQLCHTRQITYGYPITLMWIGVFFCVATCAIWIFLARALTVIKSKVMM